MPGSDLSCSDDAQNLYTKLCRQVNRWLSQSAGWQVAMCKLSGQDPPTPTPLELNIQETTHRKAACTDRIIHALPNNHVDVLKLPTLYEEIRMMVGIVLSHSCPSVPRLRRLMSAKE